MAFHKAFDLIAFNFIILFAQMVPTADPVVVRILDYTDLLSQERLMAKEQAKKQAERKDKTVLKEVRFSSRIVCRLRFYCFQCGSLAGAAAYVLEGALTCLRCLLVIRCRLVKT